MRIREITVTSLFGLFDHRIPLNLDERITIIHGPNGVGKTTILKLVHDLAHARLDAVRNVSFSELSISFEDRTALVVTRKRSKNDHSVTFRHVRGSKVLHEQTAQGPARDNERNSFALSQIDRIIPHLDRIGERRWVDQRDGELLSLDDILRRYGDVFPREFRSLHGKLEEWLSRLLESLSVHFIQTQRLLAFHGVSDRIRSSRVEGPVAQHMVDRYAAKLSQLMQENLEKAGAVAASLDRTFPHRLLAGKTPSEATEDKLRQIYGAQSEFRNRLMESGLINPETQVALPEGKIQESERKVLWFYLEDVGKKLAVFTGLLEKAELLTNIINSRFNYKKLRLDKGSGFQFVSEGGEKVPLPSLSSGEQHELVLTYELLFEVQEKSLILIDEPELSLHVTWQHKFLDDIARISELANLDFLVATHSPAIVYRRRDLMVALGSSE